MYTYEEKTVEKNGREYNIKIMQDDSPESPREWDNLGIVAAFHSRYTLGDSQRQKYYEDEKEYFDLEDAYYFEKWIKYMGDKLICLPIYMYEHGGITISTSSFNDRWDSGQLGVIYVPLTKVRVLFGWTRITKARRAKIESYLEGEINTYDQYLRGDVYGYVIEDESGEHVDSCWGYYGTNFDESGMESEIQSMINYQEEQIIESEFKMSQLIAIEDAHNFIPVKL